MARPRKRQNPKLGQPSVSVSGAQRALRPAGKQVRSKAQRPPRSTQKQAQIPSNFESAANREQRYLKQIINQVVAPETCPEFMVSPCTPPASVCVRHFKRHVTYDQASHSSLRILMNPNLFMPSFASSSTNKNVPALGLGPVAVSGTWKFDPVTGANSVKGDARVSADDGSNALFQSVAITDSAAAVRYGYNLTPGAAQQVNVFIVDKTPKSGQTNHFRFAYKLAGGAWTGITDFISTENQQKSINFALPLNAVAFVMHTDAAETGPVADVKITFANTQFVGIAANLFNKSFEEQAVDNEISIGRVTQMSCLITNTSSALQNGGTISLGRVPAHFDIFSPEPHEAISKLDYLRVYSGPLSNGGYMYWHPVQDEEIRLNDINQMSEIYQGSEKLFAYLDGWPPGASVRVTYRWTVEFYSPKQLFEKILTPPMSPAYNSILYALSMMPSATENPSHIEDFKRYVKQAAQYVKQGMDFYDEHKWIIDAGILAISSLA